MTLQEQFEQAQADSKTLSEQPDNLTMLKFYALFKQGSSGDILETVRNLFNTFSIQY